MKRTYTYALAIAATVTWSQSPALAQNQGFEKKTFDVSQTLGERALLPAVRAADPGTVIVTGGFSCREQISQNTARRAVHLAEVLAGRI